MLPEEGPDGSAGIEFQYAFRRNGERIGALGIGGTELVRERLGQQEWLYSLHLMHSSEFEMLFRFKRKINNTDGEFDFLSDIARGLVAVFAERNDNLETRRIELVTTVEALSWQGILAPPHVSPSPDGRIVLAEVYVPAHPCQTLP